MTIVNAFGAEYFPTHFGRMPQHMPAKPLSFNRTGDQFIRPNTTVSLPSANPIALNTANSSVSHNLARVPKFLGKRLDYFANSGYVMTLARIKLLLIQDKTPYYTYQVPDALLDVLPTRRVSVLQDALDQLANQLRISPPKRDETLKLTILGREVAIRQNKKTEDGIFYRIRLDQHSYLLKVHSEVGISQKAPYYDVIHGGFFNSKKIRSIARLLMANPQQGWSLIEDIPSKATAKNRSGKRFKDFDIRMEEQHSKAFTINDIRMNPNVPFNYPSHYDLTTTRFETLESKYKKEHPTDFFAFAKRQASFPQEAQKQDAPPEASNDEPNSQSAETKSTSQTPPFAMPLPKRAATEDFSKKTPVEPSEPIPGLARAATDSVLDPPSGAYTLSHNHLKENQVRIDTSRLPLHRSSLNRPASASVPTPNAATTASPEPVKHSASLSGDSTRQAQTGETFRDPPTSQAAETVPRARVRYGTPEFFRQERLAKEAHKQNTHMPSQHRKPDGTPTHLSDEDDDLDQVIAAEMERITLGRKATRNAKMSSDRRISFEAIYDKASGEPEAIRNALGMQWFKAEQAHNNPSLARQLRQELYQLPPQPGISAMNHLVKRWNNALSIND